MSVSRAHFAAGTVIHPRPSDDSVLLAKSLGWLIDQRNDDGTWGGPDALDLLISTNHVTMTLLAAGFSPEAAFLRPAFTYLSSLDTDLHVSFFWRAGALLNVPGYEALVTSDMEYIWNNRRRIGAHKDYPIPFFLLKLMRFRDPPSELSFAVRDVVRWIIEEWDPKECWYGRTSITSMAVALIHSLRFGNKRTVIDRSVAFLSESFRPDPLGGHFHPNLVDDCFTVYNLCENGFIDTPRGSALQRDVASVVEKILASVDEEGRWGSPPPFGGGISDQIYPTAVAVRALMSYWIRDSPTIVNEIATALVDRTIMVDGTRRAGVSLSPFWGPIDLAEDPICFVLMPFAPENLTDIYERYVKPVVEETTGLAVRRADDFYRPRPIMTDIWTNINRAGLIIADLTDKNANVFYELGLAHSLGKTVILLAQSIDDIPFDLRPVRTIVYDNTIRGYEGLATKLRRALDEIAPG